MMQFREWSNKCIEKILTASISICASDSASCEPNFVSPALSSSQDTMPSLSVSIFLNISFMSSTSSTDKWSAMTYYQNLLTKELTEKEEIYKEPEIKVWTYPKSSSFESIHHWKLLKPRLDNISKVNIWSFFSILKPRMLWHSEISLIRREMIIRKSNKQRWMGPYGFGMI